MFMGANRWRVEQIIQHFGMLVFLYDPGSSFGNKNIRWCSVKILSSKNHALLSACSYQDIYNSKILYESRPKKKPEEEQLKVKKRNWQTKRKDRQLNYSGEKFKDAN